MRERLKPPNSSEIENLQSDTVEMPSKASAYLEID